MAQPESPGDELAHEGEPLDRNRLDEIFASQHRQILQYLLRAYKTVPADLAKDALQSTYAQLATRIDQGQVIRVTEPMAFLKKAAGNLLLNYLSRPSHRDLPLEEEYDPKDRSQRQPISTIEAREKLAKVQAQWAALSDDEKNLLTLIDQEGLSLKEAATRLALPYKAAASAYQRAHKKLREELGRHWSTYILPADGDHYVPRGRKAMLAEIEGLPREYREILYAKLVESHSDERIAARLKVSTKEIAPRLEHALELLERKTGLGREEIQRALENTRGS